MKKAMVEFPPPWPFSGRKKSHGADRPTCPWLSPFMSRVSVSHKRRADRSAV